VRRCNSAVDLTTLELPVDVRVVDDAKAAPNEQLPADTHDIPAAIAPPMPGNHNVLRAAPPPVAGTHDLLEVMPPPVAGNHNLLGAAPAPAVDKRTSTGGLTGSQSGTGGQKRREDVAGSAVGTTAKRVRQAPAHPHVRAIAVSAARISQHAT
jgi:hypothetical protein